MALTNSQIQQVYLAITGRPAEGNAVTWASSANSVADLANAVIDLRKNSDFTSNEQFVNHLYQYLLNDTAPDAEGVAYWTGLLKGSKAEDGTEIPAISKAELIEQFINAVMAQNQTDHKYTLLNKTQIAVEFGDDVASFVGGKQAENYLKDVIFSHVDKNTSYADIEEYATNFKGQYVNVANVTVQQGAEEATEGSETNATNYNATLDLAGDGDIQINGATDYKDTLNLKVTGDTENQTLTDSNLGNIGQVANLNIDMNNAKAAATVISTNTISGLANLTIKGSSVDEVTINSTMNSVDTGASNDKIIVTEKVTTLQAGAGDDTIDLSGLTKAFKGMTINGGAGKDTVIVGANVENVTFQGVELLSGNGTFQSTQLSGKSYELDGNQTVKAPNGVDLSKLKVAEGGTVKFAVNGVKGSKTVTLIKGDDNNANPTEDTIKLAAGATKVNVKNIATGDKVDLSVAAGVSDASGAGTSSAIEDATDTLTTKVAVRLNLDGKTATGVKLDVGGQTIDSLKAAGITKVSASTADALLFVTNTGDNTQKTGIYEIIGNGANTNIDGATLKLLAVVDADATLTWQVDASALTLV